MQAYIELAIFDHNYYTQWHQAVAKSGLFHYYICIINNSLNIFLFIGKRFMIVFPKKRKAGVVKPILENKHLAYMLEDII